MQNYKNTHHKQKKSETRTGKWKASNNPGRQKKNPRKKNQKRTPQAPKTSQYDRSFAWLSLIENENAESQRIQSSQSSQRNRREQLYTIRSDTIRCHDHLPGTSDRSGSVSGNPKSVETHQTGPTTHTATTYYKNFEIKTKT